MKTLKLPKDKLDLFASVLQQFGEVHAPVERDGKFVFRAGVAISANGARRQYTGVGATAPEAVKQVLEQVAADRK